MRDSENGTTVIDSSVREDDAVGQPARYDLIGHAASLEVDEVISRLDREEIVIRAPARPPAAEARIDGSSPRPTQKRAGRGTGPPPEPRLECAGKPAGIGEIEMERVHLVGDSAGEGGLAALPRPEKGDCGLPRSRAPGRDSCALRCNISATVAGR